MFFNEPHSTHRYYGELLKAYSGKMFLDEHNPYVYYVSSLCLHKIDLLIKQNVVPHYFRHYKYHLLTAYRILVSGFIYPRFNSKDMTKYCEAIHKKLLNDQETEKIVKQGTECINNALIEFNKKRGARNINEYRRLKDFTFEVIEQAKKLDPVYHKKK